MRMRIMRTGVFISPRFEALGCGEKIIVNEDSVYLRNYEVDYVAEEHEDSGKSESGDIFFAEREEFADDRCFIGAVGTDLRIDDKMLTAFRADCSLDIDLGIFARLDIVVCRFDKFRNLIETTLRKTADADLVAVFEICFEACAADMGIDEKFFYFIKIISEFFARFGFAVCIKDELHIFC